MQTKTYTPRRARRSSDQVTIPIPYTTLAQDYERRLAELEAVRP